MTYGGAEHSILRMRRCALLAEEGMSSHTPERDPAAEIALSRVVTLREAAQLAGVSEDTLRRRRREKILRLSPRRLGMRVRDALLLSDV
jgi:hypothetical protein